METQEYHNLRAVEDHHWWFRSLHELAVHWVLRAGTSGRPRVLDAGCGTGGLLARLAEVADAEGIDGSEIALEHCRQRGLLNVRYADLNAPALEPERYDAILCVDVLYHNRVKDDAATLQELAEGLRPGGLLFLHLPALQWLFSHHDRRVHTTKRYHLAETKRLLENSGLELRHGSYRHATLLPFVALVRLISAPFRRNEDQPSDVGPVPWLLNTPLLWLSRIENVVNRRVGLPFGSSLYVVGRKPDN